MSEIWLTLALGGGLLLLCLIDIRQRRLPDVITLPLIAAGLIQGALELGGWPTARIVGACLGFGVFWVIGEAFWRWRGIEGLGQGDAKLLAGAGAWLGWTALPTVVLVASLGALLMELGQGAVAGRRIAFGPWLAGAFWLCWLWQSGLR